MSDHLRLFFALPCPAPLADQLVAWRAREGLPGRPVPAENLHLTLAFLGAQPAERLETLYQVADGLHHAPFDIRLDKLHCTRHGLLWIEPSAPPAALLALADAVRDRLSNVALPFDSQAFRAHLTLFREDAHLPDGPPPRFTMHADRFGLYVSEPCPGGVKYRALREWPLQAAVG